MGVFSSSASSFHALLRIAKSSIAEPAWFAPMVEASEDDASLTIVFHLAGIRRTDVRVEVNGQRLQLSAIVPEVRTRARRICALAFQVAGPQVETAHDGDLLEVRIPKKRSSLSTKTQAPPKE